MPRLQHTCKRLVKHFPTVSEDRIMSYAKQASKQNTAIDREIGLGDEEISDVSLSTFYVYDAENPATPARGQRRLLGAGGCGCGVGGGCSRGCGS